MKTLLANGTVVNVFTETTEKKNVLIEDGRIIGVGDYTPSDADTVIDESGKYICPGFIDGHIHIESSMMLPAEFARASLPHGTTAVVTDPHEIANVCGLDGISFMLEESNDLPLSVYVMLPSCVPATPFDESAAALEADDLSPLYAHPRVLGLAEMMNYVGIVAKDERLLAKVDSAKAAGKIVNGHAPLLSGRALDAYIAAGITDDHECSGAQEAIERIAKGQFVMIRQGTAARNLQKLLPLFDAPYCYRCMLVTDDKHPADLLTHGHIDHIIRMAAEMGKNPITGIRMATLQAAEYFGLAHKGAVAPGYDADLAVLSDLSAMRVLEVYSRGQLVAKDGVALPFSHKESPRRKDVCDTFALKELTEEDFTVKENGVRPCHVISLIGNELLTEDKVLPLDFAKDNGVDVKKGVLKLAVVERHNNTGHVGLGFIAGLGMTAGAIASSVSHDSHNLIVAGTNARDMAFAANRIRALGGGSVVVFEGRVLAEMPLPYAGLMADLPAKDLARQNEDLRAAVHSLGVPPQIEPFMTTAFVSLPVIPHLKMTTQGLVDVDRQCRIPLFAD